MKGWTADGPGKTSNNTITQLQNKNAIGGIRDINAATISRFKSLLKHHNGNYNKENK